MLCPDLAGDVLRIECVSASFFLTIGVPESGRRQSSPAPVRVEMYSLKSHIKLKNDFLPTMTGCIVRDSRVQWLRYGWFHPEPRVVTENKRVLGRPLTAWNIPCRLVVGHPEANGGWFMTDWSQCDACNGSETGHLCSAHKEVLAPEYREEYAALVNSITPYSGDAGDETDS